jgi:hypothetical protein
MGGGRTHAAPVHPLAVPLSHGECRMRMRETSMGVLRQMLKEARSRHHVVKPCARKRTFSECLTSDCGYVLLWYNTSNERTHVVMRKSG